MEVKARCPNPDCLKSYRVPATAVGRGTTCKRCGKKFVIREEKEESRPKEKSVAAVVEVPPRKRRSERPTLPEPIPSLPEIIDDTKDLPRTRTVETPIINQTSVTVQLPKSHSSSLGVSALVLSILAFVLCWIPLINVLSIILGGVAVLLAVLGLLLSVFRGGTGIGYSIGAGIVGVLSVTFAFAMNHAVAEGAKAMAKSIDKQVMEHRQAKAGMPAGQPIADAETKWQPASGFARKGDIRVFVAGVFVGRTSLTNFRNEPLTSKGEVTTIKLSVTNQSKTRKLDYIPWGGQRRLFGDEGVTLTDNFGNRYRIVDFGIDSPTGATKDDSIYPGKTIKDVIVFEKPVGRVDYLRLTLPLDHLGETGQLNIEIPASMIQSKKD